MQDVLQILGEGSLEELKQVVAELEKADKLIAEINAESKNIDLSMKGNKSLKETVSAMEAVQANTAAMEKAIVSYDKMAQSAYKVLRKLSDEQRVAILNEVQGYDQVKDALNKRFDAEKVQRALELKLAAQAKKYKDEERELNRLIAEEEKKQAAEVSDAKKAAMQQKKESEKEYQALWVKLLNERDAAEAKSKKAAISKVAADSNIALSRTLNELRGGYDRLTKAERENEHIGGVLLARIKELDAQLKSTDAATGRYQRNVGNYASMYDGLGISVQQVARELPNFAQSTQLGILAISNNLPILSDEIARTNERIKQLKAEGKDAPSLFSQIAKAALSWQTFLTIGITLLVAFSDKIAGLFNAIKVAIVGYDELAEKQKIINEAWKDSSVKGAEVNIMSLNAAIQEAKDGIISKADAVELYNRTLGEAAGKVNTLDEAERWLTKNADAYIRYTMLKAAANKAFEKSADELVNMMEEASQKPSFMQNLIGQGVPGGVGGNVLQSYSIGQSAQNADRYKKIAEDFQRQADKIASALNLDITPGREPKQGKTAKQKIEQVKYDLKKEGTDIYQQVVNLMNDVEEAQQDINSRALAYLRSMLRDGLISVDQFEAAKKKIIVDGEMEVLREQQKILANTLANYSFSEENTTKITELYQNKRIALKKKEADADEQFLKELEKHRDNFDKANKKSFEDAKKRDKERIESFVAMTQQIVNLAQSLGDVSANIYEGKISELERINELIDKNLQDEIAAINSTTLAEKEKQEQIKTAEAQANVAKVANEKKIAEYRTRQAQLDKAISIASIIQNTAVAVMQFWSKGNIPLAIAAGVAGAAQVAAVASRPIPKYEKGTKDSEGGLAVVSEKGQELVIEPDGKTWLTPATESIVMLKKHSKVIPNHELMEMSKQAMINTNVFGYHQEPTFDDSKIVEALINVHSTNRAMYREMQKSNLMAKKASKSGWDLPSNYLKNFYA
jgi:hypothetical protein